MEVDNIKIPNSIINKIRLNAPTYPIGDSMRGNTEYGQGYISICIYVQNGLSNKIDLFKTIAKAIFTIQNTGSRKYPLLIFGFGETKYLQHEKKYFDFGYSNDSYNINKVAETISRISGIDLVRQAVISELFPKTDIRSLYHGKTKIEIGDLLIIISRKNEVFFCETLLSKIKSSLAKQVFFVEIDNEEVKWYFGKFKFRYIQNSNYNL